MDNTERLHPAPSSPSRDAAFLPREILDSSDETHSTTPVPLRNRDRSSDLSGGHEPIQTSATVLNGEESLLDANLIPVLLSYVRTLTVSQLRRVNRNRGNKVGSAKKALLVNRAIMYLWVRSKGTKGLLQVLQDNEAFSDVDQWVKSATNAGRVWDKFPGIETIRQRIPYLNKTNTIVLKDVRQD